MPWDIPYLSNNEFLMIKLPIMWLALIPLMLGHYLVVCSFVVCFTPRLCLATLLAPNKVGVAKRAGSFVCQRTPASVTHLQVGRHL